jgi:hypothetical protein
MAPFCNRTYTRTSTDETLLGATQGLSSALGTISSGEESTLFVGSVAQAESLLKNIFAPVAGELTGSEKPKWVSVRRW